MITLVLIPLVATSFEEPSPLMLQLVGRLSMETDYRIELRSDKPLSNFYSVDVRRTEDAGRLSVTVQIVNPDSVHRRWRQNMPPSGYSADPTPFSGLPMGDVTHRAESAGSIGLLSHAGQYFVSTSVGGHRSTTGQPPTFHVWDREGDKIAVEGVARFGLGAAAGLDATSAPSITVAGVAVSSVFGVNGERLVDLAHYCVAKGVALNMNRRRETASFNHNGEATIIPLAARRIKDGDSWVDSSDISVVRDGKWFVSYNALQVAVSH